MDDAASPPSLSMPLEEEGEDDELPEENKPQDRLKGNKEEEEEEERKQRNDPTTCLPPDSSSSSSSSSGLFPPSLPALSQLPLIEQRWRPCWDSRYQRYYFWDTLTNTTTWDPPVSTPLDLPEDPSTAQTLVPLSTPPPSSAAFKSREAGLPFQTTQQENGEEEKKSFGSGSSGADSPDAKITPEASDVGVQERQHPQEQDSRKRDAKPSIKGEKRRRNPQDHPDGKTNGAMLDQHASNDADAEELTNAGGESLSGSLRGGRGKKKRRLNSNNATSIPVKSEPREDKPSMKSVLSPTSTSGAKAGDTTASYPSSIPLPTPTQHLLNMQTHQTPSYYHQAYHYPSSLGTDSQLPHSLSNVSPSLANGLANHTASAFSPTSPPLYSTKGIQEDDGHDGNEAGAGGALTRKGSADGLGNMQPLFPCTHPRCNKAFTRLYNLKSHLRTHTNDRPFQCDECPLAFTRNHDLRRHKKVHSGDKPFRCEGCGRQFGRMDALGRHRGNKPGCQRPGDEHSGSNANAPSRGPDDTRAPSRPQKARQKQKIDTERSENPFESNHSQKEARASPQKQSHTDQPHPISHSTQPHLHQPPSHVPPEPSMLVAVGYEDHGTENKDLHMLQQQLQEQHEQHQKQLQGDRDQQQERVPQQQQQQQDAQRSQDVRPSRDAESPLVPSPSKTETRRLDSANALAGDESRGSNAIESPRTAPESKDREDRQGETETPLSIQTGDVPSRILLAPTDEDGCMDLLDL